jgi:TonB-linked SusC/RagA family outer membrane protein
MLATAGVIAIVATASRAEAQGGTISGRITATTTSQPLADVRVLVIGSNFSATTAADGRYALRGVPAGAAQLQVLRVGYESKKQSVTVTVGGTVTADFALSVAVAQLDEVVTTATGQQRKVELGNAISTLGDVSKRVEETPINTLQDLMTGKSPSVIVLPNTVTGGAPVFRIRGLNSLATTGSGISNQPIVIIDGVRMNSSNQSAGVGGTNYSMLNALDPTEIEDIEIVKGPSAATLYGTDAANGVVVVTTKKGHAGSTQWNVFAEGGAVSDRNNYQAQYANWGHAPNSTVPTRCMLATMGPTTCISDSLTSYNLMSDPSVTFVHLGQRSQFGTSVTGGTDALRFFASGDLQNERGPVQMPGFAIDRFDSLNIGVKDEWVHPEAMQQSNFRVNLSATLTPKFDLAFNTGFIKQDNRLPQSDNNILSLYSAGEETYGFKGAGLEAGDGRGALGEPLNGYLGFSPGEIMQFVREQGVQRVIGSTTANWRPFAWMVNDGTLGVDFSSRDDYQICHVNECPAFGTTRQGQVTDNHTNQRYFTSKVSSTSTWNARTWATLKTTLGADYVNQETDFTNAGGTQLPAGGETVASAASKTASNQQPTATKTLGVYVQEQAALRDRLFLTVALRSDQNSAFGSNFQQVYYPKASVSWLMSDESWFPRLRWMDQFRLRSSYGASGVQPGATAGLATFTTTTVSLIAAPGSLNGTDTPGLRANSLGNTNLKPETSEEFEGGFDAHVLSNRVSLEFTYYRKQTHDALINVPLAPSSAASNLSVLENVGSTQNSGIEAQITAQILDTRRFGWDVTLSGSHNSNKILDLGVDPITGKSRVIGTGQTRDVVGYPINSQWFHPYTYADANGDGIIQTSEVKVDSSFNYYGYAFPRDLFSVQTGFDLFSRKLRINALFDYKGGYSLFDTSNEFNCNNAPFACRENQDATTPLWLQARNVAQNYGSVIGGQTFKTQQGYNVNGQFWKFRELSAVITLPDRLASSMRARGASLQLGARNLHWWGSYTGVDPESNQNAGDTQFDFLQASPPTYFTARLNLKF